MHQAHALHNLGSDLGFKISGAGFRVSGLDPAQQSTCSIDSCVTHLKAQGPSRTCNESKEEEEEHLQEREGLVFKISGEGSYLRLVDFCITQL